ncbi:MAG TPA: tripartite tricarboxylate transporter TctB family protein [Burkholderiales bacterium]|nr:tripartite tricarboxylate transporter TctB family protein [Burkholderiales bacterium]
MRIASPQDFWSGLFFGGLGLFACIYAATQYNVGTALRMGPGYFPMAVGGLVALLGFVLLVRSLRVEGPPVPRILVRPIVMVVIATVAYGYLLKPLGLVAATMVVIVVSALGGHEFRWREALVLAVALAIFSVLVFVYALGLPLQLWPEALID